MKKFLLLSMLVIPFILTGCGESSSNNANSNIIIPVSTTATLHQDNNSLYSVLRTDNLSKAVVTISGLSQIAGDTVSVTFPDNQTDNFTVSQRYFADDLYEITVYSNKKETRLDSFNVSVKNRLGQEILYKTGHIFTVHKIYPYTLLETSGNVPIPYPDNYVFDFNAAKPSHTILFTQVKTESNAFMDNNTLSVRVRAYGFNNQNFDNATSYNNFTVDADSAELDYNGTMYPNCLNYRDSNNCVVKITNDNPSVESSAVFYMNIGGQYIDTALNLRNTVQ